MDRIWTEFGRPGSRSRFDRLSAVVVKILVWALAAVTDGPRVLALAWWELGPKWA